MVVERHGEGVGCVWGFIAKSGAVLEACWSCNSVGMDAKRLVNHASNRLAQPRTHFAYMCLSCRVAGLQMGSSAGWGLVGGADPRSVLAALVPE